MDYSLRRMFGITCEGSDFTVEQSSLFSYLGGILTTLHANISSWVCEQSPPSQILAGLQKSKRQVLHLMNVLRETEKSRREEALREALLKVDLAAIVLSQQTSPCRTTSTDGQGIPACTTKTERELIKWFFHDVLLQLDFPESELESLRNLDTDEGSAGGGGGGRQRMYS